MNFFGFGGFARIGLPLACLGGPAFASQPEGQNFEDSQTSGNAERTFAYSYPAKVQAIPAFAKVIEALEADALAKQKAEWGEAVEEFGDMGCITCVARGYTNSWTVAAETSRFLVLQSETWAYTGGAHGNSSFKALGWDRQGGEEGSGAAFRPVDMFVSEVALENTSFGDYCASLLKEKADRLDLDTATMNPFDGCPSVTELVVIPLSSDGKRFDRLQFLAAPYVAGSFAEGPYAFEIEMTAAIMAAVKPEYSQHFTLPSPQSAAQIKPKCAPAHE